MAQDLSSLSNVALDQFRTLEAEAPALAACLSPLGRAVTFPKDIPAQSADARGKRYNGTIGQITDGAGSSIPMKPVAEAMSGLSDGLRNKALLYSPVPGIPALRDAWRAWQRRGVAETVPSSLPLVTVGLTHGLSLVADLFGGPGKKVVIPAPFWGNYRQTFGLRTGATLITPSVLEDGVYRTSAIADALAELPEGEPAVAVLNLPSNPGGYALTVDEREALRESLREAAERRPLVILCDDAYAGLVYDPEVPRSSLFWDLLGLHENLIPIKVDGATKELSFFGGRVGFLTFPFEPGTAAATILEDKVKAMIRNTLGSPVAASQAVVLQALQSGELDAEFERVRELLGRRAQQLALSLEAADHTHFKPLPFNAGCFALVELAEGFPVEADVVRHHLLDHHDLGLVSIGSRHLRVAFCSVAEADLPEVVTRLSRGLEALASS